MGQSRIDFWAAHEDRKREITVFFLAKHKLMQWAFYAVFCSHCRKFRVVILGTVLRWRLDLLRVCCTTM